MAICNFKTLQIVHAMTDEKWHDHEGVYPQGDHSLRLQSMGPSIRLFIFFMDFDGF